jgi:uncharacterized protein (TIGR03435 family)
MIIWQPERLLGFRDMKLSVRARWVIAALTGAASAHHTTDIPPVLVWDKLKGNCPASVDWASLRGKVVVVSLSPDDVFPNDIDDWKETARNFQGEQVAFIQVAGGSEFLLDQALQQTTFPGCVLFDSDRRNLKNFKLPLFGGTVVVDQWGFIAGYARDGDDMKGAVRSILNNQPDRGLDETPTRPPPYNPPAGLTPAPSYEVHISLARQGDLRSLGAGGPDRYISKNQPLKLIILDLWNTPLARIAFPEKLAQGNYDVTADMPGIDRELLLELTREAVQRQFGLRVQKEERMERVYLLSTLGNPSPQLQPAINGEKWMCGGGQGSIIGTAQTMQDLARAFEGLLNAPVVDRTGLKGSYNYSASSKLVQSEVAYDLAHQLGLEFKEAERPIEMLVVRNVE